METVIETDKFSSEPIIDIGEYDRKHNITQRTVDRYAKSRHKWQVSFFVVLVLFFIAVIVGSVGGIHLWQANKALTTQIVDAQKDFKQQGLRDSETIDKNGKAHAQAAWRLQDRLNKLALKKDTQIIP